MSFPADLLGIETYLDMLRYNVLQLVSALEPPSRFTAIASFPADLFGIETTYLDMLRYNVLQLANALEAA